MAKIEVLNVKTGRTFEVNSNSWKILEREKEGGKAKYKLVGDIPPVPQKAAKAMAEKKSQEVAEPVATEESVEVEPMTKADYESMTVAQLKAVLTERNEETKGSKAELIARAIATGGGAE